MVSKRPPLEDMTLRQLRRVASVHGIARYSRMRKAQLLLAIRAAERLSLAPNTPRRLDPQEEVEAAKFNLGPNAVAGSASLFSEALHSVDENLPGLPEGYGESRIVLMPRDPLWAYVYWDVPNDHRERLRHQGGQDLMLRVYDVTNVDFERQAPHAVQTYSCDELARDWYLPIAVSDRDYLVEIGYTCRDGRWLVLARSSTVRVPPVYPSEWAEEHFIEVQWQEDLAARNRYVLTPPETLGQGLERSSVGSRYLNGHTTGSGHHLQPLSSHTNGSAYLQELALLSNPNATLASTATLNPSEAQSWVAQASLASPSESQGSAEQSRAIAVATALQQAEAAGMSADLPHRDDRPPSLAVPAAAFLAPLPLEAAAPQGLGASPIPGANPPSALGVQAVGPARSGWWRTWVRPSPSPRQSPQWSPIAQGGSCAGVLPLPPGSASGGWGNLELGWPRLQWDFPTVKGMGLLLRQWAHHWFSEGS